MFTFTNTKKCRKIYFNVCKMLYRGNIFTATTYKQITVYAKLQPKPGWSPTRRLGGRWARCDDGLSVSLLEPRLLLLLFHLLHADWSFLHLGLGLRWNNFDDFDNDLILSTQTLSVMKLSFIERISFGSKSPLLAQKNWIIFYLILPYNSSVKLQHGY